MCTYYCNFLLNSIWGGPENHYVALFMAFKICVIQKISYIHGFPPCNSWWECHNPTTSVGLCQKAIKAHITTEKWTLHIFWSPWHTCWMEGLRVMESLMEALNSGEHFSTAVAWSRAVDYDVQLTTTWRLRRAPSANGGSRSLLLSSWVLSGSL